MYALFRAQGRPPTNECKLRISFVTRKGRRESQADDASLPSQLTYGGGERLLVFHLLVHVENDGPPVEPHVLRVNHVLQEVDRVLAPVVAGAPAQDTSQVVASAQRHDGAGGRLAL